jgi:hypothetical protein
MDEVPPLPYSWQGLLAGIWFFGGFCCTNLSERQWTHAIFAPSSAAPDSSRSLIETLREYFSREFWHTRASHRLMTRSCSSPSNQCRKCEKNSCIVRTFSLMSKKSLFAKTCFVVLLRELQSQKESFWTKSSRHLEKSWWIDRPTRFWPYAFNSDKNDVCEFPECREVRDIDFSIERLISRREESPGEFVTPGLLSE